MRTATAILLLAISSILCVWAQTDTTKTRDDELIRQIKQVPVSQLDPALPPIPFEKWLRVEAGPNAEYHWEVNDCGEQTGTAADRDRDFPLCVEAEAAMQDKRVITVSVVVGTFKRKAVGKPAVSFIQLATPHKTLNLRHLSDMPAALIDTHVSPRA
jgi:hypothetical protein